jgi:hypothetical protein
MLHMPNDSEARKVNEPSPPSFFEKHGRLLTILGALIVFVTFLVKEGKRDELKELVQSLDAAQSLFEIRQENHDISRDVAELLGRIPGPVKLERKFPAVEEIEEMIGRHSFHYTSSLSNLRELLAKFPNPADLAALNSLQERADSLDANRKDAMTAIEDAKPIPGGLLRNALVLMAVPIALGEHLLSQDEQLESDITAFTKGALKHADEFKAKQERIYKSYTWLSYLLYFVGWTLGLIGKLFGRDVVPEVGG